MLLIKGLCSATLIMAIVLAVIGLLTNIPFLFIISGGYGIVSIMLFVLIQIHRRSIQK